ncbi:MAG: putative sugar nucleotidyl transferase [Planctomycetia bacterium]|nr:putative sugar nucleotidyl transferase [Planctomycetia bacterium]
MKIVLFEDSRVSQLHPVTLGRAAFGITCATFRILDIMMQISSEIYALCRPYLEGISQYEYPQVRFGANVLKEDLKSVSPDTPILLVNARAVPNAKIVDFVRLLEKDAALKYVPWQDDPAMIYVSAGELLRRWGDAVEADFSEMFPFEQQEYFAESAPIELFDFLHDIIRNNIEFFQSNLDYRLAHCVPSKTGRNENPWTEGRWEEIRDGVFVAPNVRLGDYLVTDTSKGAIFIDEGASIGPFCYIKGPVYIGPYSKVIEHAALKDYVGLAHTTKVGGEVEASTIEPFTNKQHHGFLGHSYLGSWINLGAGTCNSDLKNTYGAISLDTREGRIATSMQFHGCVVGDYAKTAINTSIFTGKIIGSCSMVYGFVTRNVPCFTNYARSFGQCTELPVEVMISTQQRMFARRNVQQERVHVELLQKMFELSVSERQMETEPLSL